MQNPTTSRHRLTTLAATAGAFALATNPAQAVWTLLDNFDSYATGATTAATGGVWNGVFEGTGNSNIVTGGAMGAGSTDPSQALETRGGAAWRGGTTDIGSTAGIATGETGTVFFQMLANVEFGGGGFDVMTGLSAETSNIDTTNAWQDFAVMPFVAGTAGSDLAYRMTDASLSGDVIFNMTADVWYNVWLVVDNAAETYSVYYSTGTDDGTFGGTATVYRNGFTGVDLNALGFMAAGEDGSRLLVDNVHYTSGVDTTFVPEPSIAVLGGLGMLGLLRRRRS